MKEKTKKYIATFENGEIVKTTEDGIRNRLDLYNYICKNRLGNKYGKLLEITCRPYIK